MCRKSWPPLLGRGVSSCFGLSSNFRRVGLWLQFCPFHPNFQLAISFVSNVSICLGEIKIELSKKHEKYNGQTLAVKVFSLKRN